LFPFPILTGHNKGENWRRTVSDQGKVKTEVGEFSCGGIWMASFNTKNYIYHRSLWSWQSGRAASDKQEQTNFSLCNRVKAQFPNN